MAQLTNAEGESFIRQPVTLRYDDSSSFAETYGMSASTGYVLVEGQHFVPETPSRTVILFMHPSSTLQQLPMPIALANKGVHVLCCGSRYPKNDTALIMEKVAIDLGAWVRHARETLGYDKIILGGWSGGGSLSVFYQAEAEQPTITATPAGDPLDLTRAGLLPADGLIFIAAHLSRAKTLTEWIDPSVIDESDPDKRDGSLDIYNADSENQPPFSAEFFERYQAAQLARMRRITAWVRDELEQRKKRDDGEIERAFVVHRTMADPRFIDPTLEPNGRKPNWCYLGDPRTVNIGPVGLARFSTLRSWLSQWSYDDSRADGVASAARISIPLLVVENGSDDAVPASHCGQIFNAAAPQDKEMTVIEGATHYYLNQPKQLARAVAVCTDWLRRKALLE